jgi:hypothetical protein
VNPIATSGIKSRRQRVEKTNHGEGQNDGVCKRRCIRTASRQGTLHSGGPPNGLGAQLLTTAPPKVAEPPRLNATML